MNRNEYVANVLYNDAVKKESSNLKGKTLHDIQLINSMIYEINQCGYEFKYYADITCRKFTDKNILSIIESYIGMFDNEGISAELVGVIGVKGNKGAVKKIIEYYLDASDETRSKRLSVFYDNALCDIKDKRYISDYIHLVSIEKNAPGLPFLMEMLAKWQVQEAKDIYLEYIKSEDIFLLFPTIRALSCYKDDPSIKEIISGFLSHKDEDIVSSAKRALARLEKGKK